MVDGFGGLLLLKGGKISTFPVGSVLAKVLESFFFHTSLVYSRFYLSINGTFTVEVLYTLPTWLLECVDCVFVVNHINERTTTWGIAQTLHRPGYSLPLGYNRCL